MVKKQLYKHDTASYVIEREVSQPKEEEFRQWQHRITQTVSQFDGYLGTTVFPPIEHSNKWYIIVQFDSPDRLIDWLESDIRQNLVEVGKQIFLTSKITHTDLKSDCDTSFAPIPLSPPY